jgi:tetratricopeptide (TPR) repeat protein
MRRITPFAMLALAGILLATTGCEGTIDRLKANYAARQGNDAYKANDFQRAIEWYRYANYLNPDLDLAYYHTALAYMAIYKPGSKHPKDVRYSEEAIANLLRYLRLQPTSEDAKNYLLTIYLQADRHAEAAEFFERELQRGADDPAEASLLMQKIGMIYAKKGDFEQSLEWYKKRAEIEKDDPEALYTIGVLCWDKVYNGGLTLELDRRRELIDMGLDYLGRANELREDYFEATSYVNLLYREKAKLAQILGNNDEFVKFTQEADNNMKLALEMRKRAMANQ